MKLDLVSLNRKNLNDAELASNMTGDLLLSLLLHKEKKVTFSYCDIPYLAELLGREMSNNLILYMNSFQWSSFRPCSNLRESDVRFCCDFIDSEPVRESHITRL